MNSLNNDCINLINEFINIETKYKLYFVLGKTFNWNIEDILDYKNYIEIKKSIKERYWFNFFDYRFNDMITIYDLIPIINDYKPFNNLISFKTDIINKDQSELFINNKFYFKIFNSEKFTENHINIFKYYDGNLNKYHYFILKI